MRSVVLRYGEGRKRRTIKCEEEGDEGSKMRSVKKSISETTAKVRRREKKARNAKV